MDELVLFIAKSLVDQPDAVKVEMREDDDAFVIELSVDPSDVGKVKLDKLYKAILPFLIPLILVLFLCTYVPGIVTWLPNMLLH